MSHPAISTKLVRKHFNRAASTYDDAAVLQRELTQRLLENFDFIKITPNRILDIGCGTGAALAGLQQRFPQAEIIALDLAENMLRKAAPSPSMWDRLRRRRTLQAVCADFSQLPFKTGSIDLIVSSFALHWSPDLQVTIKELSRVLAVGGLVMFTVPGPDTLKELRKAAAASVHQFPDMHDVGDLLVHSGLSDPVMDRDDVVLTYATPEALLRDMKALGTTFAATGHGLRGKTALMSLKARLEAQRLPAAQGGHIPASYEVVTGHAWKVAPKKNEAGHAIVAFDPKQRGRP